MPKRGRSERARAAAVALAAVAGAVVACGQPASAQVRLEPVSYSGPRPFTSPVGQDLADLTPVEQGWGDVSGDTAGLYADSGGAPPCDARALVSQVASDEAKSRAWAQVLGVEPAAIEPFVTSLNPVLLRSDTAVVSHDYANGRFEAHPAVLQVGTAVFIDGHGQPVVKCFNGNPLTPGEVGDGDFTGPRWSGFQPGEITAVRPAVPVVYEFSLVDARSGAPVTRPGGPNPGRADPYLDFLVAQSRQEAARARADADEARRNADAAERQATVSQDRAALAKDASDRAWAAYQENLARFGLADPRTVAALRDFEARRAQYDAARAQADRDREAAAKARAAAEDKVRIAADSAADYQVRQQDTDACRDGRSCSGELRPDTAQGDLPGTQPAPPVGTPQQTGSPPPQQPGTQPPGTQRPTGTQEPRPPGTRQPQPTTTQPPGKTTPDVRTGTTAPAPGRPPTSAPPTQGRQQTTSVPGQQQTTRQQPQTTQSPPPRQTTQQHTTQQRPQPTQQHTVTRAPTTQPRGTGPQQTQTGGGEQSPGTVPQHTRRATPTG
ncbi:DUF6777 domain-containing protein [Saccharopolyspora thermophila]|nr:DUF6777 domain-containing protein [Saccharopolyspora subtropica]